MQIETAMGMGEEAVGEARYGKSRGVRREGRPLLEEETPQCVIGTLITTTDGLQEESLLVPEMPPILLNI